MSDWEMVKIQKEKREYEWLIKQFLVVILEEKEKEPAKKYIS